MLDLENLFESYDSKLGCRSLLDTLYLSGRYRVNYSYFLLNIILIIRTNTGHTYAEWCLGNCIFPHSRIPHPLRKNRRRLTRFDNIVSCMPCVSTCKLDENDLCFPNPAYTVADPTVNQDVLWRSVIDIENKWDMF